MKFLVLSLLIGAAAATLPSCAANRLAGRGDSATVASRKNEIVNRLIPENGLTTSRRSKLIESTIAVLGTRDREEMANVARLRETLQRASLRNLEKIEADYKERLANTE